MTRDFASKLVLCVAVCALATIAGCAESTTLDDGGGSLIDATPPGDDGSVPGDDGSAPGDDASVPTDDGGIPGDDGGGGFDSGPPESCTAPGTIESVACGLCGTVDRFCTACGTWSYGLCEGEGGACVPGTVDAIACGDCGTQSARCTASCTWETTGACTDEGECTPGDRTRSGTGCPAGQTRDVLCGAACAYEPETACMADGCPTPGAIENVTCGMCGRQDRFCNASRVWEYGACSGEGVCMPGTTGSTACGMCGTQATRCTDTCTYATFGTCGGEGTCTPGATQRTATGCPAEQMRVVQCDAACGYNIVVDPCRASRPVDVTFLLDITGSNASSVMADLPTIQSRCIAPLLALTDVEVGVSYAGEFPTSPYGTTGDRPFEGGIEPTTSAAALTTEIAARPSFSGNDAEDAAVVALSMLNGGPMEFSSVPLVCSAGRVAGGCWRTGAQRMIVVHTDSSMHNGPIAGSSSLLVPYTGIAPAPATWPEARTRMIAGGTLLAWLDSDSFAPAPSQYDEMLTDLGQPLTDHYLTPSSASVGTACDAIVARVRALAGL